MMVAVSYRQDTLMLSNTETKRRGKAQFGMNRELPLHVLGLLELLITRAGYSQPWPCEPQSNGSIVCLTQSTCSTARLCSKKLMSNPGMYKGGKKKPHKKEQFYIF